MLYLVRHGETPYNTERRLQGQTDIPLSDRGREQARELGERLKAEGPRFDKLYSSRLSRAYETARIAGEYIGLVPQIVPGLEEIYFGNFEGRRFDECAELYPEAYADFTERGLASNAHGGETGTDVFLRARAALLSLPEAYEGRAMVVAHGAVIGFLRAAAAGRPLDGISDLIPGNTEMIEFGPDMLDSIKRFS